MNKTILFIAFFSTLWVVSSAQTSTSVLAAGDIYKMAFEKSGIVKLDYNYLKNTAKIDIDRVDPRQIKIFGNGGGMLPGLIQAGYNNHEKDLVENAIFVAGESDGKFDAGDFILFYAEGPEKRFFNQTDKTFYQPKNAFDSRNFYFLKIDTTPGLRIGSQNAASGATYSTDEFDDYLRFEEDKSNLLGDWNQTQGSGQRWYGDQFKNIRSRSYADFFNFPNLVSSAPVYVKAEFAGRAFGSSTYFLIKAGGKEFRSNSFSSVGQGTNEDTFAFSRSAGGTFNANSDKIEVTIEYPNFAISSEGWLDYVEMQARRKLRMAGDQLVFQDINSLSYPVSEFRIGGINASHEIWDITNPLFPKIQNGNLNGDQFSFSAATQGELKNFIVFNKNASLNTPVEINKINNQNLHGLGETNLLILYHPDFEEAVQQLAEHRRNFNNFKVATIEIGQVFNEFSSGRVDPVGMRDFVKMLYDRRPESFKYLLLFGDGSFDYRDIYKKGGNFIPVYETIESHDPIESFPTDDYFVLLSEGEGAGIAGTMEVAVGRLLVETADEAKNVVNKIIHYETSPKTMQDWRNRLAFVSDDEDGTLHIGPSDNLAKYMDNNYSNYNLKKIYIDAFPQISTPGGQKYPAVNEAIDRTIFKGALAINYFGHGGSKGWAQERILKIENIINWENFDKLPLFITATCSFTGYDEPSFKSAGEQVLLNPRGGAIALFSTVRAVYVSGNVALGNAVFQRLFETGGGNEKPTLGDIFKDAKNNGGAGYQNSRKFTLIGDPSMHLAIPKYQVLTTAINNHDISDGAPDTLRALQKVTIEGFIADADSTIISDFSGTVYPTIFDKKIQVFTLGNDALSPVTPFDVQENVLFKGRASVTNGRFKFTFVLPKDINYEFGSGKISYYAEDGNNRDASGNYQNIIIGKTDASAIADNTGPKVEVFMNSEDFVFGSITDENPVILVKLSDDNGINISGTSIGHDLTGILNDNSQNTYIMNDFYEAALDDFTSGEARYPLAGIPEGRHRIKVRAWDVANNSGEGFTEFVVASSEDVALKHVLNYPNPFTDRTCFMFEHNMAGQPLSVQIQIFTVSGRLVKTLQANLTPEGYILGPAECIEWDGKDDYGDQLARGVYIYRVKVDAAATGSAVLSGESSFEKLVILK